MTDPIELPELYFDATVQFALQQMAQAEKWEKAGRLNSADVIRRTAVAALDNRACDCAAHTNPEVYDQDARDVSGIVVDNPEWPTRPTLLTRLWNALLRWLGFR